MSTKLYYFDINGRADFIRFLLHHAKVEFEDIRINHEQFAALKAEGKLEFGQVPMLEVDGKQFVQTYAILRYLGKQYGYYPESPLDAWKVDSIVDATDDFLQKYFGAMFEKNEEAKKTKVETFLQYAPTWIAAIQKRIESNESPDFVVGSKRTVADFALACIAFNVVRNEAGPLHADFATLFKKEDYPVLTAYLTKLHEELKDYLTSRPSPRPF